MPALKAIFTADATGFRNELVKTDAISSAVGKKIAAGLSETAVFLEQQIIAAKRAGVAFGVYETELAATKIQLAAINKEIATEVVLTNAATVATKENAAMSINWRAGLTEALVILREIGRGNWARVPSSFSRLIQQLGLLKYLLTPLAGIIIGVATAGYFLIKASKELVNGVQALNDITGGVGQKFKYMADAMDSAAERTQAFNDWIKTLGESHKTTADGMEETLSAMREEAALKDKLDGEKGATPKQQAQSKIQELKDEAKVIQDAAIKAGDEKDAAKAKAIAAEKEANNPDAEANFADLKKRQAQAAAIYEKVQDAANKGGGGFLNNFRRYKQYDIKGEDGKTQTVELNQAKKTYEALTAQAAAYGGKQKSLNDAAKEAAADLERKQKAVDEINKAGRKNHTDLTLAEKYLPDIADNKSAGIRHGSVNSLQQIGAYTSAATVTLVDVNKQMLKELKGIRAESKGVGFTKSELSNIGRVHYGK